MTVAVTRYLLVGEFCLDVHLSCKGEVDNVRLGGLAHACRAMCSLSADYSIAYFCPDYLDEHVEAQVDALECDALTKLGNVTGCPLVMLVGDPQEAGSKKYELLLRQEYKVQRIEVDFAELLDTVSEVLILEAGFPLDELLAAVEERVLPLHVDVSNSWTLDRSIERASKASTVFLSVDKVVMATDLTGESLVDKLKSGASGAIVLKHGRGGSELVRGKSRIAAVGAHPGLTSSSIGVGDVFDACFVVLRLEHGDESAMAYASWIAAAYAYHASREGFEREVEQILGMPVATVAEFVGLRLPWSARGQAVYVAAADFDYRDTRLIDDVASALTYHNFSPRLPVREHGQVSAGSDDTERLRMCFQDLDLLCECALLVAVVDVLDAGVIAELGFAKAAGKPVIFYQEMGQGPLNPMLVGLPDRVVTSLDELITATFELLGRERS